MGRHFGDERGGGVQLWRGWGTVGEIADETNADALGTELPRVIGNGSQGLGLKNLTCVGDAIMIRDTGSRAGFVVGLIFGDALRGDGGWRGGMVQHKLPNLIQ